MPRWRRCWRKRKKRGSCRSGFNAHKGPQRRGERIDWILGRGVTAVDEAAILDYVEAGLAPSDHYPVTAQVTF